MDVLIGLFVLVGAFGLLGAMTRRLTPFSSTRASVRVNSLTGENLAVVVATVAIATALLGGALDLELSGRGLVDFIVTVSLIVVIGLAVAPRLTLAVLAPIALIAEIWTISAIHGPEAGLLILVWAVLLLWVLGLVRGFFRPF